MIPHLRERAGIGRAHTLNPGGRELRKKAVGVRDRPAPRVRAQIGGSGWGGDDGRSTQRDFLPEPEVVAGPGRGRAARPAPARRWASNSEARGASAERCPVTGPDSAKSRGKASSAAPAAASLTGRSDHGCAPHSPARSLAAPAAPCICQLRPARFAEPPGSPGALLKSVASSGRRLASHPGPCPPRSCPRRRLPPGANSAPPCACVSRAAAAALPRAGWGCTESSMLFSNPPRGHSSRGNRNPRPHLSQASE